MAGSDERKSVGMKIRWTKICWTWTLMVAVAWACLQPGSAFAGIKGQQVKDPGQQQPGKPGDPQKKPDQKQPEKPLPPPPPPPPPPMRDVKVDLDVLVTDAHGKPQAGLTARDFAIEDEGERTPTSFHGFDGSTDKGEPPVQVLLVLDTVNNSPDQLAQMKTQVAKFLRANGGKLTHPVSLVEFFPDGPQIQTEPSSEGNGLAIAVDQLQQGSNGDVDPFNASLQGLEGILDAVKDKPGRKLLIWPCNGWITPEVTGAMSSARDEIGNWNALVAITNKLRENRVVLYGGHEGPVRRSSEEGMTNAAQMKLANLGLDALAVRSGGHGLGLTGSNDVAAGIESIFAESGPYYRMTFASAHANSQDAYHLIHVSVKRPGLSARTNAGYFTIQPDN